MNGWIDGDVLGKSKYFPFFDLKEFIMARQEEIIAFIALEMRLRRLILCYIVKQY